MAAQSHHAARMAGDDLGIAGRYILAAVETLPADPTRLRIQIGRHKAVNAAHDRENHRLNACVRRANQPEQPIVLPAKLEHRADRYYEVALLSYATKRHLDADMMAVDRRRYRRQPRRCSGHENRGSDPVTPVAAAPTDQPTRKQRVLAAVSAPSNQHDPTETVVSVKPSRTPATIPATHSGRIRTLVKYGMRPWQVAAIYRVEVDEVRRLLKIA
jgi:hypothetical protein